MHEGEPLAHSSPQKGLPADTYARHVEAVRHGALERATEMLRYAERPKPSLLEAIEAASVFHDLGKLDPENQSILKGGGHAKRLKWDHIDAGVAHLSAQEDWMAAWLVRAHHAPGLPQKAEHFTEHTDRRLRGRRHDDQEKPRHDEQINRTDAWIKQYVKVHESVVSACSVRRRKPIHGVTMRLALSCLVDADYSDTAFFDSGYRAPAAQEPQWAQRRRRSFPSVVRQHGGRRGSGEPPGHRLTVWGLGYHSGSCQEGAEAFGKGLLPRSL